MVSDLAKDRLVTHGITNYLLASYQGKFASLNILSQVKHPSFTQDDLVKTQQALNKASTWCKQLFEDECLFAADWTIAETFEAQAALDMLIALKPELYKVAAELNRILSLPDIPQADELSWLVATQARHAYSKDSYIRGFINYGERFSLKEMRAKYEPLLPESEYETVRTQELLAALKISQTDPSKTPPQFLALLFQSTVALPATFRCHIHDINQLLSQFNGGLTFQTAEFNKAEADLWRDVGFGPGAAGYWRAYGIAPDEAKSWYDLSVPDPMSAIEWKKGAFNPQTARTWIENQFIPPVAYMWQQAGYTAEKALELINKGVQTPPPRDEE